MKKDERFFRHRKQKTNLKNQKNTHDRKDYVLSPIEIGIEAKNVEIRIDGLIEPIRRDLFIDWTNVLMRERLAAKYSGGSEAISAEAARHHRYTTQGDIAIEINIPSDGKCIIIKTAKSQINQCIEICREAREMALHGNLGNPSWWRIRFASRSELSDVSILHMIRTIGQHKKYQGNFRLGSDGYVIFNQDTKPGELTPFPNQSIEARFRSIGPDHGPFARKVANKWAALIRGLLTLCTASNLEWSSAIFPIQNDALHETLHFMETEHMGDLHINGQSLWQAVATMHTPKTMEAFDRLLGALQAFEQALCQRNDGASIVFFVTAIEALATPNAKWRHERLTKRFTDFLLEVCPDVLTSIRNHANIEMAFGKVKSIKHLAELIYKLRSARVHTGNFGYTTSMMFGENIPSSIRVALVSDIAHAAIVRFLFNPIPILTGHPNFDQRIVIFPESKLYQEILIASSKDGFEGPEKWLIAAASRAIQERGAGESPESPIDLPHQ